MSEEKMYVVKNDEGKYWDFYSSGFWKPDSIDCIATPIKKQAELVIKYYDGHVVTFIEEPEKVVLTKEQAEIVEGAHVAVLPACYISEQPEDEELLMKAYVNGYTVAKEKKYNVKVPHTKFYYWKWKPDEPGVGSGEDDDVRGVEPYRFTLAEIEHYGLQNCERVVCADSARTTGEEKGHD